MALFPGLVRKIFGPREKRSYSGSLYADMLNGLANPAFASTTAGQPITDTTAITISCVFAAIRNIADDIGKLDKAVYRKLPRGKVQIMNHPMHKLMCQSPNPEMGPLDFFRAVLGSALLYGNGYARIIRDRYTNEPVHVYPIHPYRVRVLRDSRGMLYYSIDGMTTPDPDRGNGRVEIADMIHIKGFGLNGLMGLALTKIGKESLGLTLALEQFGASFFGNSALPKGIFTTDGIISKEGRERLVAQWEGMYRGSSNAFKTAVMEGGVKWQTMAVNNNEGQFLETRAFQLLEVCRLFRIPPHKLMDVSKGTMNNMEVNANEYVSDCLVTWIVSFEEEFRRKLTRPEETDIYPKFILRSFFRGDMTARTAYYSAGIQWGYLNRNDIREMEDFNPVDGLDTFLVPQNFSAASALETMTKSQLTLLALHAKDNGVELDENGIPSVISKTDDGAVVNDDENDPAEQVVPEMNVPPPTGIALPGQQIIDSGLYYRAVAEAQKPVLADALRRVLRTEGEKVVRAAKKDQGAVDHFYSTHPEYIRAAVGPVISAIAGSVWAMSPTPATDEQRAAVDQFIASAVAKHTEESRSDLATEIELSGIETRTAKWTESRPERVAGEWLGALLEILTGKTHE